MIRQRARRVMLGLVLLGATSVVGTTDAAGQSETAPQITSPPLGWVTDAAPLTLEGTAPGDGTVTVVVKRGNEPERPLCSGLEVPNDDGELTWTCGPLTLVQGQVTIVTPVDGEDPEVRGRSAFYVLDTIAPQPPVFTSPAPDASVDARPTFEGTGEAGALVGVRFEGRTVCNDRVDGDRRWSCQSSALPRGPVTVTAAQRDPALNRSTETALTFRVRPVAPTITVPAEGATVAELRPEIGGTGLAGATVTVRSGTTTLCTDPVEPEGGWSCRPTSDLPTGSVTITADQTDPAGDTSSATTRTFAVSTPTTTTTTTSTPIFPPTTFPPTTFPPVPSIPTFPPTPFPETPTTPPIPPSEPVPPFTELPPTPTEPPPPSGPIRIPLEVRRPASPLAAGDLATYRIDVGPDDGRGYLDVVLEGTVGPDVEVRSVTTADGPCGRTGSAISCSLGDLDEGERTAVTAQVRIGDAPPPSVALRWRLLSGDTQVSAVDVSDALEIDATSATSPGLDSGPMTLAVVAGILLSLAALTGARSGGTIRNDDDRSESRSDDRSKSGGLT